MDLLGLNEKHLMWFVTALEDELHPVVESRLSGQVRILGEHENTSGRCVHSSRWLYNCYLRWPERVLATSQSAQLFFRKNSFQLTFWLNKPFFFTTDLDVGAEGPPPRVMWHPASCHADVSGERRTAWVFLCLPPKQSGLRFKKEREEMIAFLYSLQRKPAE